MIPDPKSILYPFVRSFFVFTVFMLSIHYWLINSKFNSTNLDVVLSRYGIKAIAIERKWELRACDPSGYGYLVTVHERANPIIICYVGYDEWIVKKER